MLGAAALLVGVVIGAVGIGGVLLPPALILIGGVGPHHATAISLISFVLAGVVSTAVHLRGGELPGALTRNLAIGLLPGALVGGWLSGGIPDVIILASLAGICLFSALWTVPSRRSASTVPSRKSASTVPSRGSASIGVVGRSGVADVREQLSVGAAAPLGLAVGFGSAVTGTSGPVLLTPALMALRFAAWRAIVTGQVIQTVVTPAGAVGYLAHVRPDLALTAVLSAATAVGTGIGSYGSRQLALPEKSLRLLVTALLVVTGVLVTLKLALVW